MAGQENAGEMSCPADLREHRSWGLWLDLGKTGWEMTGSLGYVSTAHNTWLSRVITGFWTSGKRSEPNKNGAGRELGDLSNTAATDRV